MAIVDLIRRESNVQPIIDAVDVPDSGLLLQSGLVRNVRDTPDAVAIWSSAGEVSYAALHQSALRIAAVLKAIGVGRGDRVVLRLDKSATAYAALVGVLYAGATYVPLHALSPDSRVREQIGLVVPAAAIFIEWCPLAAELVHADDGPSVVVLNGAVPVAGGRVRTESDIRHTDPLVEPEPAAADDLAYVMFTSGSTGRPKAVPITHRSARFFLDAMADRFDFRRSDRFTQLFDFAFDLSVFDMFVAWNHGASVCAPLASDMLSLADYARRFAVTVWFSVPSAAALVMKRHRGRPQQVASIRLSLFCGEALPWRLVDDWRQVAPGSRTENLYGPTELTIACTAYDCSRAAPDERNDYPLVPIGETWPGMITRLLDPHTRELITGEGRGELAVAGQQRFDGYLQADDVGMPFVECPVDGRAELFYLTGDLVERDGGGNLHFLGRNDSQIKLDGLRVDLAEIEAVACELYGSAMAVAMVDRDSFGLARSVTIAVEGASRQDPNLIMRFKDHLPSSWCPLSVSFVEQIPRGANGKVDRVRLAAKPTN